MKRLIIIIMLLALPVLAMRIPSASTDRKIAFVAVDATDRVTRETGLTAFTVYYSLAGGTATAYNTPTIAEPDTTNFPGLYWLTLDEGTTLASGHSTDEYVIHITCSGMDPVSRAIEVYRPSVTEGEIITVSSGAVSNVTTTATATAVTTNNDKTGYTVSTVSDKAGYSLSVTPPTAQNIWEYGTRALTDKAGFGLADDAITAGKFDETTAYPVKSADSGATALARTGADSDTLETLSDQIDAAPTAAEIWDYDVETAGGTGYSAAEYMRILAAVMFGYMDYTSGTGVVIYKDPANGTTRATITLSGGDRTGVTLDGSD